MRKLYSAAAEAWRQVKGWVITITKKRLTFLVIPLFLEDEMIRRDRIKLLEQAFTKMNRMGTMIKNYYTQICRLPENLLLFHLQTEQRLT